MMAAVSAVDRVRSELGLSLTSLENGLRKTFQSYEQQQRPRPDFSWEDNALASIGVSRQRGEQARPCLAGLKLVC